MSNFSLYSMFLREFQFSSSSSAQHSTVQQRVQYNTDPEQYLNFPPHKTSEKQANTKNGYENFAPFCLKVKVNYYTYILYLHFDPLSTLLSYGMGMCRLCRDNGVKKGVKSVGMEQNSGALKLYLSLKLSTLELFICSISRIQEEVFSSRTNK